MGKKKKEKVLTGEYCGSGKSFGFVSVEDIATDFFISGDNTAGAFHGDTVEIKLLSKRHGNHIEAKVVNILERKLTTVVGTYEKGKNKGYGFVVTDNRFIQDVFIDTDFAKKAKHGDKVVVELTSYGGKGKKPEGKVIKILGKENDKGVDVLSVVYAMGIPENFEKSVMKAAEAMPDEVLAEETVGRLDLRDTLMVTIDGEDAKDLDDAVSLSMDGDKYVLGVHIADVSHYVREKSVIDKDAVKRGCSNYLIDRVIPMLPFKLSNGICSLNAHEDRLAMSCIMTINKNGDVDDYKIKETVIKVNERMNYTSVNKIINGDQEEAARFDKEIIDMLIKMKELSLILRSKRRSNGAIDFDTPESKFILDENSRVVTVKPYEANDATKLIEEFMLMANQTVASHMFWQDKPFLYRIHEEPDRDKLMQLDMIVRNFGYYIKGINEKIHPKEIQKLINEFTGRDEETLIMRLALRSMKQARYSPECTGHFGLACKQYTHFTSPIRRYPDLIIHRILKEDINGKLNDKRIAHYEGILDEIAKTSSKFERRANEAERLVEKIKKAEYMSDHIGQEYDGIISGVTQYGIYVELPNTCEGLVHISKLPGDYFEFDEKRMIIEGVRKGKIYSLGMPVRIMVKEVDLKLHTVDFELARR